MRFLFADVRVGKTIKIPFPFLLWFSLPLIAVILELSRGSIGNYLIFKHVFFHTLTQENLYLPYPDLYQDTNHYGPLFAMLIAPFAMLPNWAGAILWAMANATFLFFAIRQLPFKQVQFYGILLIGAIELMSSTHQVQFNPMVAAWLILSYVMVDREKELWATLFIAAGFLCKLYGIAGLSFFLFSKHQMKFIGYFLMWLIILYCLPMVISSPAFVNQSYQDWFHSLRAKDAQNASQSVAFGQQDISVTGILRRIFQTTKISDLMLLAPAALLYALPLLRISQYKHASYRMRYLALTLITVVIYSSSAESVTYIIAVTGVTIWYMLQEHKTVWTTTMLVILFLVTILSTTDLCPPPIQRFIRAYALKALPCFIVWLLLLREVAFKKFSSEISA